MSNKWTEEYRKEYMNRWRKDNVDYIKNYAKKWRDKNKENNRKYLKNWRKENPEKVKIHLSNPKQKERNKEHTVYSNKKWRESYKNWRRRKTKEDIVFRINNNMGSVISKILKGEKEGKGWGLLVGYTAKDLIKHLEKQFDDKMKWDNYAEYWEVDHIIPKSHFNYKTPTDEEFKKCWGLENLQPLEKSLNRKKHNKIKC
jgi:hypothetical protein